MFKTFKEKAQMMFWGNTAHNPSSNDREGIWDGFLLTLSYTKMVSISVRDTRGSEVSRWNFVLVHPNTGVLTDFILKTMATIKIHAFSAKQKNLR